MPTLSIVIPALNEERRLPRALETIRRYTSTTGADWEVIVVDDGSDDGTATIVRDHANRWANVRLVQHPRNLGKGAAVKTGLAASRSPIVGFTDADLAAPIEQLDLLIDDLSDSDVAIVSRALPGASLGVRQSPARELMGRLYSRLTRMLVLQGVPDAQCGLKLYRADAAREIFAHVGEDGILFDTEALLIATERGFHISQRPAVWNHDPDSRIRFNLQSSLDVAVALLRLRQRHRIVWPLRAIGAIRPPARDALGLPTPPAPTRAQIDEVAAPLSEVTAPLN